MTDDADDRERGLSKREDPHDVSLERALKHPVVQHMAEKLEEMRRVVDGLPEAIGRAVSEAMRNRPPAGASGPGMPIQLDANAVEFHRGGKVNFQGKEEIGDPFGVRQLLVTIGEDGDIFTVDRIASWTPEQRQKVVTWARAVYLKRTGAKGVRVPSRPQVLKNR